MAEHEQCPKEDRRVCPENPPERLSGDAAELTFAVPVPGLVHRTNDVRAGLARFREPDSASSEGRDREDGGQRIRRMIKHKNPYAKEYSPPPRAAERQAARFNPYARGRQPTSRQAATVATAGGPTLQPRGTPDMDVEGNKLWDEKTRPRWLDQVKVAMPLPGPGCAINGAGCTGGGDSIDHIKPFALVQSELTRFEVCATVNRGRHHYSAIFFSDALVVFNGGNQPDVGQAAVDLSNLQFACTHCNSVKNGPEGLGGSGPRWIGPCPTASGGTCNYNPESADEASS